MSDKPIILISSCHDALSTGDAASNGGLKVYNNFANLLIEHGYEAYVVTWTGEPIQWLIHHAPYISIEVARQWKAEGKPLKFMTGWWRSQAFLELVDQIYFYDCELAFTCDYGHHRGILEHWLQSGRIAKFATHSRTQQAWYMATYEVTPRFIPEWSSDDWKPCPENRIPHQIGFFDEGASSYDDIHHLRRILVKHDFEDVPLIQLGGSEASVLRELQKCDLFVGLNRGKHALWGEGCPRTQQEAQHAGAVVVAFDVNGNHEYLFDGYNGYLVPNGRVDRMAARVIDLLTHPQRREALRMRSIDYALHYFAPEARWNAVAEFLDLEA